MFDPGRNDFSPCGVQYTGNSKARDRIGCEEDDATGNKSQLGQDASGIPGCEGRSPQILSSGRTEMMLSRLE